MRYTGEDEVRLSLSASCGCGFHASNEGNSIDDVINVLKEAVAHASETKHKLDIRGSVNWR